MWDSRDFSFAAKVVQISEVCQQCAAGFFRIAWQVGCGLLACSPFPVAVWGQGKAGPGGLLDKTHPGSAHCVGLFTCSCKSFYVVPDLASKCVQMPECTRPLPSYLEACWRSS